jgi:hypothetical protein
VIGVGGNGVNGNTNGVNRARRVTIEEKYRQEREREAELEGVFFCRLFVFER